MLTIKSLSPANHSPLSQLESFNHWTHSSLNTLEYITAIALGLAQEQVSSAAEEGKTLFSASSPADTFIRFSTTPTTLMLGATNQLIHFQEFTANYFDYVEQSGFLLH